MEKNPYPGKCIVIEGLDGSGQTTQVNLLKDFLLQKGIEIFPTKEPTKNSEAGKRLRELLDKKTQASPREFQDLFAKDRVEHLRNEIIPALQKGIWVISDRYFFTSFAYGVAQGVDLEYLIQINSEFLLPDLAFFLNVSPDVCIERIKERGTGFTYFERKTHFERAWKVFELLAKRFENVFVIQGEQSIQKVAEDIQTIVKEKLLTV
ncbi:MAG: dTMP kinase [Candidatus Wildermuthbacteria bacterium]|nr:dTMP kinase [Candidatus Wildermuthbacteria bacterium]